MKLIYTEAELPQGSGAWRQFRAKGIGGSEVACLMYETPYESIQSAWETRVGLRPPKDCNSFMKRGNDLEPDARRKYEEVHNTKVERMCLLHPEYTWMRTSLDGVTVDRKYVLEIKCPKDLANHRKQTRAGKVPMHRRAQIQHQLAVCNAHWGTEVAHYWSYVDDDNYALIEVRIDHEYIKELIRRERIFLDYVERKERPPVNLFRENEGLIAKAVRY